MSKPFYVVNVIPHNGNVLTFDKPCGMKSPKGRKCRRPTAFSVFYWDGRPALSRLTQECCDKHLPEAVKKAYDENQKLVERDNNRIKNET